MVDWYECEIHSGKTGRKLVKMRTTYPEAQFEFIDVTAAEDGVIKAEDANDISNVGLLLKQYAVEDYATLELNSFILDGSKKICKEFNVPYISREKSDSKCRLQQRIEIEFQTSQHSSAGFTIYCAKQYQTEVKISCEDRAGSVIAEKTFEIDNKNYFCEMNVQNYSKVIMVFNKTMHPMEYMKINGIVFGQIIKLDRKKIKSAKLYEEVDSTSATLPVNTAQIEFIDQNGDFDTKNKAGLWKALQRKQGIKITEYIDDKKIDCGTFYLTEWSYKDNVVNMSFEDALGFMDKTTFNEGEIYRKAKAGEIIKKIMDSFGHVNYEVQAEVANTALTGYLGIQSHRAALQQVAFACGAVADCSRSDKIRILKENKEVTRSVEIQRKFIGTSVRLDSYVSEVAIEYNTYSLEEQNTELFKGELLKGTNYVEFSEPCKIDTLQITSGTLTEKKTNYVIVQMEEDGECVITGIKYKSAKNTVKSSVTNLEAGEVENVKKYSGCTMIDAVQAQKIAKSILDYYSLRQIVNMKVINDGECAGDWCNVADTSGNTMITGIVSQSLDLTGGNIAEMTCRGYSANNA